MRWLLILLVLLPSLALAQFPISRGGTVRSGPRILGEPAFAFELDALEQAEASRPGWPVTTTRASTRMCWTGSAWQTVPANTPCIGASGLASFGAGTNYIANSTAPVLTLSGGATVATVTEGGLTFQRITMPAGSKAEIAPAAGPVSGDAVVATVEVKGSGAFLLSPETSTTGARAVTLGAAWARESFGRTSTTDPSVVMHATSASVVDLAQAQLERGTTTPGPRHDCGASACSWAADVHTVSATGWPVEAGEIRLQYTPLNSGNPAAHAFLIDARTNANTGFAAWVEMNTGRLSLRTGNGTQSTLTTAAGALAWVGGTTYDLRFVWGGGSQAIYRDGVLVASATGAPMPNVLAATATVGGSNIASGLSANGHIRLLRVSQ